MGISRDVPAENRAWAEKMGFQFPLLSDPEGELMRLLGAERPPDDKLAGIPRRITYLVDPELVIRRAYLVGRDDLEEHPYQVLDDLKRLSA